MTLQIKSRIRHGVQNFLPNLEHVVVDLRKIVEADESHKAVFSAGGGRDGIRIIMPHVAKMAVLKAQNFFRKKLFVQAFGVGVFVRKKIINRIKPRRIKPADTGNLNRRRFVGHDLQQIIRRMSRQLNQNINLIFHNPGGNFIGGHIQNISESVDACPKLSGDVVFEIVGVNENFKARLVVAFEKIRAEKSYDVIAHVPRNVTDANFFVPRMQLVIVLEAWNVHEQFIKDANFLKNFFTAEIEIMHIPKIIAVIFKAGSYHIHKLRRIFLWRKVAFGIKSVMLYSFFGIA